MSKKKITICESHFKYEVPLISTFAFSGAEYWCPFCGQASGMFGGKTVESTPELEQRLIKYKEESKEYLGALSTRACSSLMFEGKRISPDELPQEEKDRIKAIIDKGWKRGIFIE